jgi:transcriptional regulator of acetoin/glycerol metabolism
VREADVLTATQQASLARLLRRSAGELQIVSIARVPLFPLVAQGLFLDEVYYRLNAMVLEPSRDEWPD